MSQPYEMLTFSVTIEVGNGVFCVFSYKDLQTEIDVCTQRNNTPRLELYRGAMEFMRERLSIGGAEVAYKSRCAERERDQFIRECGKVAIDAPMFAAIADGAGAGE